MDVLLKLPGISRKIANIILAEAFEQYEGIVVDTHVMRVAQRLGLTQQRHPKQIELDLMNCVEKGSWADASYLAELPWQPGLLQPTSKLFPLSAEGDVSVGAIGSPLESK